VYVIYSILLHPPKGGENESLSELDGMTSLSVRQYILGVLKAHGLNEKDVTKVGLRLRVMRVGNIDALV
jgi:hypothetical protein